MNNTIITNNNATPFSIEGIIAGALIIIIGQIIIKFFINPIIEYQNVISEIKYSLIYFADVIDNPGYDLEKEVQAAKELRHLSSLLRANTWRIKGYRGLKKIRVVKKCSEIKKISENLIGISNSIHDSSSKDKIGAWLKEIEKML